jgi:hypothetical protein
MSTGITYQPSGVIYSKVDSGTGYKSYAVPSIVLPAGAPYIRATVSLQSARQRLAVFINGYSADHSFTVTQLGRTVTLENKTDFSAFTAPITLSFSLAK